MKEFINKGVVMYHVICTCYIGRLCLSQHKTWKEFEETRCKDPNCETCSLISGMNNSLLDGGFDTHPGPNSTYTKIRGF